MYINNSFSTPTLSHNNGIQELNFDEINSVNGGLVFNNAPLGFSVLFGGKLVRFNGGGDPPRNAGAGFSLLEALMSDDFTGVIRS